MTLGFSKPPSDISAQQLFNKMGVKIREILASVPKGYPGPPLLKTALTEKQWSQLHQLLAELNKDYKLRREMLLTRLDVTVLSFTVKTNVVISLVNYLWKLVLFSGLRMWNQKWMKYLLFTNRWDLACKLNPKWQLAACYLPGRIVLGISGFGTKIYSDFAYAERMLLTSRKRVALPLGRKRKLLFKECSLAR